MKHIQRAAEKLSGRWGAHWGALRAFTGLAVVCHGLYLLSDATAAGNWLELRASAAVHAVTGLALILGGALVAAGWYTRVGVLLTAPLYYWVTVTQLISATAEPVWYIAANAIAFLALMLFGVFGPGKYTAREFEARKPAEQTASG